MEFIYALLSLFGGYYSWKITSTPGSKINKKVPKVKIKNVQFLPTLKITVKGKVLHIHHWMFLTVLTGVSFVGPWWLDTWIMRAFMVGGVLQGLRFPDRNVIFEKPIEE